jgi:hypothetical protein
VHLERERDRGRASARKNGRGQAVRFDLHRNGTSTSHCSRRGVERKGGTRLLVHLHRPIGKVAGSRSVFNRWAERWTDCTELSGLQAGGWREVQVA